MSEQIFTIVVGGDIFNSFIHSSEISSVYKRSHFVICSNIITYVTQHVKSQEENEEERANQWQNQKQPHFPTFPKSVFLTSLSANNSQNFV